MIRRRAQDRRNALLDVWGPAAVLTVMVTVFAVTFCWLALARHAAFQSHAFDLGNMDQAAWNTIHGRFLRFTDMDVGGPVLLSRFAIHVEPLLVVVSLLYFVHAGPETLLVTQVLVVSLGAIPAYLLASLALGRRWFALVFPAAYLLHPSLQNVLLDDFHTVSFSACFLLWAVYFALRRRVALFIVVALLAAATKEEIGLLVALLGIIWLVRRRVTMGVATISGGVVWFLIAVQLIVPAANPGGRSPYLTRYAYLGHGLSGIVLSPIRHPGLVASTLASTGRLGYLTDLLHPLGYAALLGLPFLALSLPGLLINLLSADSTMYSGFYQYSAEIVPYVVAGAAVGVAAFGRLAERAKPAGSAYVVPVLCFFVLVAGLVDSWRYGFSPLARGYLVPTAGAHQHIEEAVLSRIPAGAAVAAADEIEPHISERRWAYLLPTVHPSNGPAAEYVALDASVPSSPVTPRQIHAVAERLLRHGYGIDCAQDGVLLLRRGGTERRLPSVFYSWIFSSGSNPTPAHAHWGPLALTGFVVHPRSGYVNRSRPAIGIETFWRTSGRLSPRTTITFYLSPVYTGTPPPLNLERWSEDSDSPTWDWLPFARWPSNQSIAASSLGMLPAPYQYGKVDVAIGVGMPGRAAFDAVAIRPLRLGTISVEP